MRTGTQLSPGILKVRCNTENLIGIPQENAVVSIAPLQVANSGQCICHSTTLTLDFQMRHFSDRLDRQVSGVSLHQRFARAIPVQGIES